MDLSVERWFHAKLELISRLVLIIGVKLACRAAFPLLPTLPLCSISRTTPIGGSTAVVTTTDSQSAQSEDKASPRNPKVTTVDKSEKEDNFEV